MSTSVGIVAYFLTEMGYPIAPLVIGVILGPMADQNLRRALMVSGGSFVPMFTRPVSLILFLVIVLTVLSQVPAWRRLTRRARAKLFARWRKAGPGHGAEGRPGDGDETQGDDHTGETDAREHLEHKGRVASEESASESVKRPAKQ